MPIIERALRAVGARLLIIDPLMAYLGAESSAHRDQDVRRALAPVARLAEDTGAAVLIVRHLNKRTDGNPLYRGGGSIGIIGAARSGLLVARDPDHEDRRVLASTKSNLARMPESLSWELLAVDGEVARVRWLGASAHSAGSLLVEPESTEEQSSLDEAAAVLADILAAGPVAANEARRQARAAGVADRTTDRAKARLGVVARRSGFGPGGSWLWALPPHTPPAPPIDRPANSQAPFGSNGDLCDAEGELL